MLFFIHSDVVTDALGIYSTYIALNALTPVELPDDIRQRVEGTCIYTCDQLLFREQLQMPSGMLAVYVFRHKEKSILVGY